MKLTSTLITIVILLGIFSCKESIELNPNTTPKAVFIYAPTAIDTSTIVTFDASQSEDAEDALIDLRFSWDFEGQQQWTDATKSTTANYMYKKSGTYLATLKVEDSEGWSSTTQQAIIVRDSI